MAKRNELAKKDSNLAAQTVTFIFNDNADENARTRLTFDLLKVPEEIKNRLALHGASQKLGDGYAGSDVTVQEAKDAVAAGIETLYAGNWGREREPGEGTLLAQALVSLKPEKYPDVQTAEKYLDSVGKEKVKEIRKHPAIEAAVRKIQMARAEAKTSAVDLDAVL